MEMGMENFWNGVERRKLKHTEKVLFTTNPAWAWLGRTQVFTVDKSPANRLRLHKDKRSPSLYIEDDLFNTL
jgi:hypothetical protein